MKKIVVFDEYNEIDLKPSDFMRKYTQLTEKDIEVFFIKNNGLKNCDCPGCHGKDRVEAFQKFGMKYVECVNCSTLYISPRPDDKSLNDYYNTSTARNFWHDGLSKHAAQKRREKIIVPRLQWILDSTQEYLPEANHFVDVNTEQYGYIEELMQCRFFKRKTLLSPCIHLDSINLNASIEIVNAPMDGSALKETADVVAVFEVADRSGDIDKLFAGLYSMLKQDGLCFMTDILISGFDLQTLWDKAENIFPPDRLNVFSVEGLQILFKRHNFECLEFSTPGILDVEIVENFSRHYPQTELPKFVKYFLKNRNAETKKLLQEFLQENLLSSYARILLRKK